MPRVLVARWPPALASLVGARRPLPLHPAPNPPGSAPRRASQVNLTPRLAVADAEVLHLAVAEVPARHDVELPDDATRDVPGLHLRLPVVDLLEPGVDSVTGEVAREVAVAPQRAADVVVELACSKEGDVRVSPT